MSLRHLISNRTRVPPRLTIVVRLDNMCVKDVARVGIGSQLRLEKSRIKGLHREEEDCPGASIDDERRIRETDLIRPGRPSQSSLNRRPRLTAILRNAVDDRVCLGCVLAGFGASIPRGDDPTVGGRGQRGDAVAFKARHPGRGQASDLADRVVLGGFHRVGFRCARAGKNGDGLGIGGNSTGDHVVAIAVTGRRPGRGRGEGTGC